MNKYFIFAMITAFSCATTGASSFNVSILQKGDPLKDRIETYDNAKSIKTDIVTIENENGYVIDNYVESIQLANGDIFYSPKMLAEALPGTPTEEHYKKALAFAEEAQKFRRAAILGIFVPIIFFRAKRNFVMKQTQADREYDRAFLVYNQSLRMALGLCIDPSVVLVEGDALVDCAQHPTLTP